MLSTKRSLEYILSMCKQVFVVFVSALIILDPLTRATTMNANVVSLLLFAGLNISAIQPCRSRLPTSSPSNIQTSEISSECLVQTIYNNSDNVNFSVLFNFENINDTNNENMNDPDDVSVLAICFNAFSKKTIQRKIRSKKFMYLAFVLTNSHFLVTDDC